MAVGVAEAVGGPVTVVAVAPPLAQSGGLDRRRTALQRRRIPRPQRHVAEARQPGLGQLQAVALGLAPAAQEHRLAVAVLDLHPEQLDEEPLAGGRERGQQLGVVDVGEVARELVVGGHVAPSTRSRSPLRS